METMYNDAAFAGLPRTIAMMGNAFAPCSSSNGKKMMERERNRRQARKSRTLKKQCAERMQEQLNRLRKEAEEAKGRDRQAVKDLAEHRQARCRVLRKVFDLRADGCADEDAWLDVVSADLRLTMPITPYRFFDPADVVNNRRVLLGVDGIISDTQSLKVTRDNIGIKSRQLEGPVSVQYTLGSDENDGGVFFNTDGLMCNFTMRTLDAVAHGACAECEKNGMIRASFNSENKIEELDITFDAIAFYHQLMLAAGKKGFPVVPNTLDNALKDETSRIVVTTARRPFRITHVNKAWTDLCGFELEECQGKSLDILQGPETDMDRVADLCKMSQKGYAASMVVTNHNKKGQLFRNHLRCYPVSSEESGQVSHIVGMLSSIPSENEDPRNMVLPTVQAC